MTIDERLAEIENLALRHFPTQFDYSKRLAFRLEKVEQLCRELDYMQKAMDCLKVREL